MNNMRERIALLVATCGNIGGNVGGGTIISYAIAPFFYVNLQIKASFALLFLGLAFFSIPYAQAYYKKNDPHEIVIDEAIGSLILLIFLQARWDLSFHQVLLGLLLFRVFDISKLGGIKYIEKLPGVAGVVLDDIAASLYAYIFMHLFV